MSEGGTILLVEDEANMRRVLSALLSRDGHEIVEVANGALALERLEAGPAVDAVLTDLRMPQLNGLELLAEIRERWTELPVVLLTAHGTVGSAVEALKQGAFDYLTKPFDPDEVRQVLLKAVHTRRLDARETRVGLDEDPEQLLLGRTSALVEIRRILDRVSSTSATILITGESGTGKELVARSVHERSDRAHEPFVKINCAAIPEGLLESELFGHERGAFTGAASRKPGRFELAHRGTLFLDEIGEMPLASQPKLLRALQEGRFFRVGGTETIDVDVRLVAATNRDLHREVAEGRFREDLFYRLHVVPIELPPLRERRGDIPELVRFFIERFNRRFKRSVRGVDPAAMAALQSQDWPGNLRELENAIERAILLCDADRIRSIDVPAGPGDRSLEQETGDAADAPLRDRVRRATRQLEREAILEALDASDGNVTRAARQLGLSRRGLQLKMKELEIAR
jgi:DNA-binding NtrC family response regulator